MRVEWASGEPDFVTPKGNSARKFYEFAFALRENPGQWAKYPGNFSRHMDSARAIAGGITAGRRPTFPGGKFEARVDKNKDVWVRFVG